MRFSSLFVLLLLTTTAWADVPPAAAPYQRALTREARLIWGLNAPVAAMAAQIQQESAWRPDVCSAFACGLAQFTPSTAAWISGAYPTALGANQPFSSDWAIRALAQYDYRLYAGAPWAKSECDRWAFALSGYNGGPGWITRDRRLCEAVGGCDPDKWFEHVERYTARSPSAAKENRSYPRRILLLYQVNYSRWGGVVACSSS